MNLSRIIRNIVQVFAALMLMLAIPVASANSTSGSIWNSHSDRPASVANLVEGLLDSVVNISTTQKNSVNRPDFLFPRMPEGSPFQDFFDKFLPNLPKGEGQFRHMPSSLGSGFVIDTSGIIVTNNHVITDADEITVNFNDGSKLKAELIGEDPKVDIAILRVKPEKPIKAVQFGDSDRLRIGDRVMAIGNPLGLSGTVTLGIVSAINRNINSGPYNSFIQTDAAINQGNSGGPLFDMEGKVVGINTAIISPSGGSIGLGFSIPSSIAKNVVDQLVKYGKIQRGWLGVSIREVTDDIAEALGMGKTMGVLVEAVITDGPADKAGVRPGDVILSFDSKPIEKVRNLQRIVADTPVDKQIRLVIFRKGKRKTLQVSVGLLEDGRKEVATQKNRFHSTALRMTLGKITNALRKERNIDDNVKGVFIFNVEEDSDADIKGIRSGQIIVEAGQEAVFNGREVNNKVMKLQKSGHRNILLMISDRSGSIRFVVVEIDNRKQESEK